MRSEPSLYQRLAEFALDNESASFKFSSRLARENGWSLAFATKAIDEYKKFVYLAATSPTQVTPSDVVDQVWHLHLTYSRSYWDEMCTGILGKELHHGPTKGGASEDAKYRDLYAATLAAYAQEFGEEAPAAFWPPSDARFKGAAYQRWVDTREHLVLSWRTVTRATAGAIGAIALTSTGAALAAAEGKSEPNLVLGFSLLGVLITAVVALSFLHTRRRSRRNGTDDGSSMAWIGGTGGSASKHHNGDGHGHGGEAGGESGGGGDGGSGCGGGGGCGSS